MRLRLRFRTVDTGWRVASAAGAVVVVCLSAGLQAETIDRVLAVVAGQIITLSDVTAAREFAIAAPGVSADPVRAMLLPLIDRELVLAEVERYAPPEPAADAVDREMTAVRARFPTAAGFESALARSGVDDKHVRELLRQNLRIRAYLNQRFPTNDARRESLIDDWVAGLRRRGDVIDLYVAR